MRVNKGNILGAKSHVSVATLARLLLAMTMFRPIYTIPAILGKNGTTIPPWGIESSQEGVTIGVAYAPGSIALEFRVCASGLAGVMQLTMRAMLPNFAFFAVRCPVTQPVPRGRASSLRDREPNPLHVTVGDIKARDSGFGLTRSPQMPILADFPDFGILTPAGNPVVPRCQEILGSQVA